jgi:hypothetical protein
MERRLLGAPWRLSYVVRLLCLYRICICLLFVRRGRRGSSRPYLPKADLGAYADPEESTFFRRVVASQASWPHLLRDVAAEEALAGAGRHPSRRIGGAHVARFGAQLQRSSARLRLRGGANRSRGTGWRVAIREGSMSVAA